MTWKQYLINLLNAAISGGAVVLAGGFAGLTGKQIAVTAGTAMVVSAVKWYLQHPPPGVETVTVEKSLEPTTTGMKATTTTTTSTETK